MILKVFGIYDSKVNAYLPPFMMKTIGEAERALISHCNDSQHNFCKHAEDFTLFELGEWDDSTAKYKLHSAPHSIACFIQYKRQEPQVQA